MIQIQNLYKSFGDIQALKNISVEIGEGELFGFIGPDGAGKTTLFRILTSLLIGLYARTIFLISGLKCGREP